MTNLALLIALGTNWLLSILEHFTVVYSVYMVYHLISVCKPTDRIIEQLLSTSFENWGVFTHFHSQNLSLLNTPGLIHDMSFVSSFLVSRVSIGLSIFEYGICYSFIMSFSSISASSFWNTSCIMIRKSHRSHKALTKWGKQNTTLQCPHKLY